MIMHNPPHTRVSVVTLVVALAVLGATPSAQAWNNGASSNRRLPMGVGLITAADTGPDFNWTGHVDATHWVRVRNLSGWVHVEHATGKDVEIRGHKRWHSSDPDSVRITLTRDGGDVLVCALFDDESTCDEQGYSHHSHRYHHHRDWDDDGGQSVDFTVMVPDGIKVLASTVNGDVRVTGATDEVIAESVNGRVDASTLGGPVKATSVNGSVEARMTTVRGANRLEYSSVNGSVEITLPADLKADVELTTMNGAVRSDFPILATGSIDPRHLRGTIGGGGIPLRIETVNGSIELRKAT
jgi:hypothetical protein